MAWPIKRQWQIQIQRQRKWQRHIHLESDFKEQPQRLVTFETFDQSDDLTWPDQQKNNDKNKYEDRDNDKDKYIWRTPSKCDPRDLWPLRHLIRMRGHDLTNKTMTKTKTKTKTIPETCDIWDTNYNYDNWEPEFMTIFVAWQLRVTLDSIRNSCDVFFIDCFKFQHLKGLWQKPPLRMHVSPEHMGGW